ncbi:hypothetical protein LPN04_14200 [Rugamonas sp. A1-17]|nr:hypothetical protein [Rugamonas sp. A1-17]
MSRALREVYRRKKAFARLDDDLLAAWRAHSNVARIVISELMIAFQYRHWLAHGRYWPPKFGRSYDYQTVYSIADSFLSAMAEVE